MIEVVKVKDRQEGNLQAYDILAETVNHDTLLALSGGTSPDYKKIFGFEKRKIFLRSSVSPAGLKLMIVDPPRRPFDSFAQGYEGQADDIIPGAVCLADERYGGPYHPDSNELVLKKAGLFHYLDEKHIEYHRVLGDEDFYQTAEDYDRLMFELFERFENRVGVMGLGANLHTAGIFPHSEAVTSADFVVSEEVVDKFPERITLTLKALEEFQTFIILAFGEAKKGAIIKMLDEKENDLQKYPAIFYRTSGAKSYLITDLNL